MTDSLLNGARQALSRFNLQDSKLTTLDRTLNAVFRVNANDGRRRILRLRSPERFDDAVARVQIDWLDRWSRQPDIGAPVPLRTTTGRRFVKVRIDEAQWRATCLTWVHGRSPKGKSFLRPKILYAVGKVIGRMHQDSETFRPADLKRCPQLDAKFFFGPGTASSASGKKFLSTTEHDLLRRAADRIRRALRRTCDSASHVGIIHGDLEPPNWVIDSGVPRPIDFDEFGVGHFAFDLMQTLWTHALWKEYPTFRTHLLQGYDEIRPLSAEDRRELDLYQAIPFITWLNRESKNVKQSESRQWVAPTLKRVAELCGLKPFNG